MKSTPFYLRLVWSVHPHLLSHLEKVKIYCYTLSSTKLLLFQPAIEQKHVTVLLEVQYMPHGLIWENITPAKKDCTVMHLFIGVKVQSTRSYEMILIYSITYLCH